jgi:antitoxin component YwqK of YwqJK toxin-antitoxin module
MKRTTLFIAACAIACSAKAIIRCEMNGKPINPNNGFETAGLTGMLRCSQEDTGKLQREYELRNGKSIGLERYYDRSGKLMRERTTNERGNSHGPEKEFWPHGQLKSESTQDNGSTVGAQRRYYEDGQLEQASFTADRRVQAALSYNPQGQLTEISCHTSSVLAEDRKPCGFEGKVQTTTLPHGRQSGKARAVHTYEQGQLLAVTTYREDGQVWTEQSTQNGARWHRVYDSKGAPNGKNVLREEKLFEPTDGIKYRVSSDSGPLQWRKLWGANEQLVEHVRYTKASPSLTERWYLNGAMKEKITVLNTTEGNASNSPGARSVHERFDDSGRLSSRETSVGAGSYRAQLVGVQQYFHANGKLAAEDTYSPLDERGRSRLTARKEWDDTGKLLADDELLEDGSRKRK